MRLDGIREHGRECGRKQIRSGSGGGGGGSRCSEGGWELIAREMDVVIHREMRLRFQPGDEGGW